jgi:hypothetical protein
LQTTDPPCHGDFANQNPTPITLQSKRCESPRIQL